MTRVSREHIMAAAAERRERIKGYMTQDPPLSFGRIRQMEGMTDRSLRQIVKELEAELGVQYMALHIQDQPGDAPYGLTTSTSRLRQKLADALYTLLERGSDGDKIGRHTAAPRVGLNNREQIRAESRPFNHDWKLSQIERLARELNRDPREFLLSCLTG